VFKIPMIYHDRDEVSSHSYIGRKLMGQIGYIWLADIINCSMTSCQLLLQAILA